MKLRLSKGSTPWIELTSSGEHEIYLRPNRHIKGQGVPGISTSYDCFASLSPKRKQKI